MAVPRWSTRLPGTDLIDEYRFLVLLFIMGRGRRFFPEGDASDKAAACEQQEAQFRDPCSDLPAGQKITVWFCATCSPGCLSIVRFHSKMYTSNEPGEAFQPNMHLVAHPVGIFTHFNGISGTEQAGGFTKCGHEPGKALPHSKCACLLPIDFLTFKEPKECCSKLPGIFCPVQVGATRARHDWAASFHRRP